MNDPRESMEGAPLLGTPKEAYSNVPKRLVFGMFGVARVFVRGWQGRCVSFSISTTQYERTA